LDKDDTNIKGITLIEVLIAMAITGIIITAVYSLLLSGFNNFNIGKRQADVQKNIRLVERIIKNELQNTICVVITGIGECNTSNPNSISLEKGQNGQYHLTQNGHKITDDIFSEIYFNIKNRKIINFIFEIKGQDKYQINILLNNHSFTTEQINTINGPVKLTESTLYYHSPD
jgi:prepilin-type N-terminal cleavage/methylation domain-containing protein